MIPRILITTGDSNGIGLEITLKALKQIRLHAAFFVFYKKGTPIPKVRIGGFKVIAADLSALSAPGPGVYFLPQTTPPAEWVERAANICIEGRAEALVTGPLDKAAMLRSGYKDLGHTEIFRRLCPDASPFMTFLGRHFNVLLATGHIPLQKVPLTLTEEGLAMALSAADKMRAALSLTQRSCPIALVGLNPHAGEAGLLGREEETLFAPLIKRFTNVRGPLVPDVAFAKPNWKRYSFFVCPYHDQGLIPFKMIHGFGGVHITAGLPFIRTSVDHGTAKDIAGKNLADPTSMVQAIKTAIRLAKTESSRGARNVR